jgi:hypothetical protein
VVDRGVVVVRCRKADGCSRDPPAGVRPSLTGMSRAVFGLIGAYVLSAVLTTLAEAAGVGRQCGCVPDRWCRRRGLRLFRWVAPVAHRAVDPAEKRAKEQAWRT